MLNQCQFIEEAAVDYEDGASIRECAGKFNISVSTMRARLIEAGVNMRTKSGGIKTAAKRGRMSRTGTRGPLSDTTKAKISTARTEWAEKNARGVRETPAGYIEYTRGPHKGRLAHVVAMEARVGRRLLPDECVHHIDGDPSNNAENNLALVTRSGHTRIHRREDDLSGRVRERNSAGQFKGGKNA